MRLPDTIKTCSVYCLGVVEYTQACRLQEKLSREHAAGMIGDVLLIMEHRPVMSIGKGGCKPEHLLVSPDFLEKERITVCNTNRGGGITYHGQGQLVCYPILDLRELGITVRQYIEKLEEVLLRLLKDNGIQGRHLAGSPGIWVGDAEIASIGINVSHGITMHGFTVNICNDLKPFTYIAPCGVAGKKMTTISHECGFYVPAASVIEKIIESFSSVFDIITTREEPESLEAFYDRSVSGVAEAANAVPFAG